MELTLRYSLQNSSIKPEGVTGEYARLQVDSRPEQDRIIISANDYRTIIRALSEGRLIGMQSEDGDFLGQFTTSLSGGVIIKDFNSPSKSDIRFSFKSTQHALSDVRELASFERVPTVKNDPTISEFVFTDNAGNVFTGEIPISTNGLLYLTGENFVKNGMQVTISQLGSTAKARLNTQVKSGAKYIDILTGNTDVDTANGFVVGDAILTVRRKDNNQRKDEYECKIV